MIQRLSARNYQIATYDASLWTDLSQLHTDFASSLEFPTYYGRNLDALNDCLFDVASGEYGIPESSTGLVLVFEKYHAFHSSCPEAARAILDIVARNSRYAALIGRRIICLVQSDDPHLDVSIGAIGGVLPDWNNKETMYRDRGL